MSVSTIFRFHPLTYRIIHGEGI